MSRAFAAGGVILATACGILVSYTTFQPEFEKQRGIRQGTFKELHPDNSDDRAVSRAIISDFKEAGQQVRGVEKGDFAWGIRQAIWGKRESSEKPGKSNEDQTKE